jgi:hypothetical protein
VKNLEAILRANDLSMLEIYFEDGTLRVILVEFDLEGTSKPDVELSVEADEDDDTIEKLLALLEEQAEITLRENAAQAFWKIRAEEKETESTMNSRDEG